MRIKILALLALAASLLSGCGYNTFQTSDEQVKAAWSEVLNQYQRRADLVPNLVNTVQGLCRAREGGADAGDRGARQGRRHPGDAGTDQRSGRRSPSSRRRRPDCPARCRACWWWPRTIRKLKADAEFRDLQAQLEGTENRITVARNRYIKAVQDYNVSVRTFPNNLTAMLFGYKTKPNFTVENEKAISAAPKVDFGGAK